MYVAIDIRMTPEERNILLRYRFENDECPEILLMKAENILSPSAFELLQLILRIASERRVTFLQPFTCTSDDLNTIISAFFPDFEPVGISRKKMAKTLREISATGFIDLICPNEGLMRISDRWIEQIDGHPVRNNPNPTEDD